MNRDELKEQIDELMRQYDEREIDRSTYAEKMMDLTTSAQNEIDGEDEQEFKKRGLLCVEFEA